MKVLVVGNSQAGALKRSHDAEPLDGLDLFFHVIPGGMGPDLRVEGDRLVVGQVSPTHPPYSAPAGTEHMPLGAFDAILVSALGYVDGGFAYKNPITTCGTLVDFRPRGPALKRFPVSDTCFREMLRSGLESQPGIQALRGISAAFRGPVLVQPFPCVSSGILEHEDWGLRQWYADPLGAHRFISETRDAALEEIAAETGARLLPRPVAPDANLMFDPALMREDCIHQGDTYGALVLRRLAGDLARL